MSLAYYDFLKSLNNLGMYEDEKWLRYPFKPEIELEIFNNTKAIVLKKTDDLPFSTNRDFSTDNLPFDHCWFELSDKTIDVFSKYTNVGYKVRGVFVSKEYGVLLLIGDKLATWYCFPDDFVPMFESIINNFIERFNTEHKGMNSPRYVVKTRLNNKKQFRRISEVIYVSPKKNCKSFGEREIDWSYRFDIRGHWRTLKPGRLGKTANGELTVGKTWVKPFIKGDEKLPYIKKVRVI